ncbi:thiamine pyrophosphate-binding protein [Streptomyces sp. NPDC091215]|uniref:thiamine pyrophosphate-binding protein n=1 Tax=Streptomyces sp. NPDC091215 TaxID=3155192 RepID=UPI00342D35CB
MKTREALVNALVDDGIDTVFCLMGDSVQHLMADLAERPGMRLVHGRHEASVVSMADGYARFSGRTGCAMVTAGPGLTNTATALAVARAHGSPVLLLAGDRPAGRPARPADLDQQAFGSLTAGEAGRLVSPDDLPDHWRQAQRALADHRPYVLSLPVDVQDAGCDKASSLTSPEPEPVSLVSADEIRQAADALARARTVGIVAGRGALVCGAGPALRELADRLGAVLSTTLLAHGLFTGHPADAGMVGELGTGRARRALEACDVVLAVGTSIDPMVQTSLPGHARYIVVDREPLPSVVGYADALWIRADALVTVDAINRLLSGSSARELDHTVAELLHHPSPADARAWMDTDTTLDPRHVLTEIADLLPADCGVVLGGGHAALNSCHLLRAAAPTAWTLVSTDFGAIGQSLPVAIGCALARPERRTYHVTGDGDLMMSLSEVDTAVRYALPLTVVVLNDQGFGQERVTLGQRGRPAGLADHPSPDFAALADAMGAQGHRIEGPADLGRLAHALGDHPGPVLVDIRTNPAYLNPAAVRISRTFTRSA